MTIMIALFVLFNLFYLPSCKGNRQNLHVLSVGEPWISVVP